LENAWSKLSPRERGVALLIAGGLSNKDIARELGLSLGTVKVHVHAIFQKLGVRSRYGLIARHGAEAPAAPLIVDDAKFAPLSRSQT
jgi:DNA-binding NarL/FixJ family response regulator